MNVKILSSILDYPHPGLDPAVWGQDGKLLPEQKAVILDHLNASLKKANLKHFDKWASYVHIVGSLTTYQYISKSDCDVHILVDIPKFIETENHGKNEKEVEAFLDEARKNFFEATELFLKDTKHPVEYYFVTPKSSDDTTNVGIYDVLTDEWVKDPVKIDRDFDIEVSKPKFIEEAGELAGEIDASLGNIKRQIMRIEELQETIKAWDAKSKKVFKDKLEAKLSAIEEEIQQLVDIKTEMVQTRHTKEFDSKSEDEIKFKYLQKFGYFYIITQLKELLEATEDKVEVSEEKVPEIKEILNTPTDKIASKEDYHSKLMIDFDGTIAKNHKDNLTDNPMSGAKEALEKFKAEGWYIVIYSCRANDEKGADDIREFMKKHDLPYDELFIGKPMAEYYIDDRNIVFTSWSDVEKTVEHKPKKEAALDQKYWVTPNGEFIPLGAQTHSSWVYEHIKEISKSVNLSGLTPRYEGAGFDSYTIGSRMLEQGWIRLTTDNGSGFQFGIEVNDLDEIPDSVNTIIDKFYNAQDHRPILIESNEGDASAEISDPFPSIQDALSKVHIKHRVDTMSSLKTAQHNVDYDFSSTHFMIPKDIAQQIVEWSVKNIPNENLHDDETNRYGRELESHITILFGLLTNDSKGVEDLLKDEQPVRVKFKKTKVFENDMDAIFIEVDSEDVERLHDKLKKLDNEDQQPNYHPHCTVAYVKSGLGKEYVDVDILDGLEIELDTVKFSPKSGDPVFITLGGKKNKKEASDQSIPAPHGGIIMKNPTADDAEDLFNSSDHHQLRWGANGNRDLYIWDANLFTHYAASRHLGFSFGYQNMDSGYLESVESARDWANRFEKDRYHRDLNRAASSKTAGSGEFWFDPSGKQYPVKTDHKKWMVQNQKLLRDQYGINLGDSEPFVEMLRQGWVRVGAANKSSEAEAFQFVMQIYDINKIPDFMNDFVVQIWNPNLKDDYGTPGIAIDNFDGGDSVIIANPFPSLQKAVRREIKEIMSKHIITDCINKKAKLHWVDPNGQIKEEVTQDKSRFEEFLNQGWVAMDTTSSPVRVIVDDLEMTPDYLDTFLDKKVPYGEGVVITDKHGNNLPLTFPMKNIKNRIKRELYPPEEKTSAFLPSIVQAPDNHWTPDSDVELPLDPDTVSAEETYYTGNIVDKPQPKSIWDKLLDMFKGDNDAKEASLGKKSDVLADILHVVQQTGGATWNFSKGNLAGTQNYAVSIYPEHSVIVNHTLTMDDLNDYIQSKKDLLSQPENSLGIWKNGDKYYLDVSLTIPDKAKAIELGKKHNQISIFDLNTFQEIPTGGTGEVQATEKTAFEGPATTWDGTEPFTPLPTTFEWGTNDDNLNSRYPWKFMRKPTGPNYSNESEVDEILVDDEQGDDRPLSKTHARLKRQARSDFAAWIDPSGKVYSVRESGTGGTHLGWIETNLEALKNTYHYELPDGITTEKFVNSNSLIKLFDQMIQDGWVRVGDSLTRNNSISIQLNSLRNIPSYVDDYLATFYQDGQEVEVEEGGTYTKQGLAVALDNPFPTLQKAVNRAMVAKLPLAASLNIDAFTQYGFWVAPDGQAYDVRQGGVTHAAWIQKNAPLLKSAYGINDAKKRDYYEVALEMLNKGWVRIGDVKGATGVQVGNLRNIPTAVDDTLATFLTDGQRIIVADVNDNWAEIIWPVKSVQSAVLRNRGRRAKQAGKPNSSSPAQVDGHISPEGQFYAAEGLTHDQWAVKNFKKSSGKLVAEGWMRIAGGGGGGFAAEYCKEPNDSQWQTVEDILFGGPGDSVTIDYWTIPDSVSGAMTIFRPVKVKDLEDSGVSLKEFARNLRPWKTIGSSLKTAGGESNTYTDDQMEEIYQEQHQDVLRQDDGGGYTPHDFSDSSTDYPKPEDTERKQKIQLDLLDPATTPPIASYEVTWYFGTPADDNGSM